MTKLKKKIQTLLKKFYEASAISFWKIEAQQWEKLFKEQRGGETFTSIQEELAKARTEIYRLETELKKFENL